MTNTDRHTRQRGLIAAALADTDQWLTAQQVHRLLADGGQPVGLATVYRTLTTMAATGQVDVVRAGDKMAYRRCSPSHHHHLTCRNCGRTVEIAAPPLEVWASAVAAEHGYGSIDHIVELTGLCPSCQG